ncbi:MAG: hypothetical protein ABT15_24485 [Pseudonocardia sp. SCN 73-27]|nr:MAG: hypothetical protein ABS80_15300 [Pseudonocardia sp. SCN 72-51]ODV02752.1 MAG: hypothetical protein ABT15_24485 [Pseudonocardia sp. SCN 73-27]
MGRAERLDDADEVGEHRASPPAAASPSSIASDRRANASTGSVAATAGGLGRRARGRAGPGGVVAWGGADVDGLDKAMTHGFGAPTSAGGH